ncbi:cyclophilin-like fold protein [Actinomyces ruminis]|uniref:Cyclophilin-like domain-containing protein n=1 Tax=Actinomyces ruminis TaxID=1937003 RepID=A0ABX4MBY3_9ACTO|nr:cyclophilin-like fold protein [Actinomyces ruminis]PHP52977.1 hypothetical protein BW737_005515 [Actinomyces ruminis]
MPPFSQRTPRRALLHGLPVALVGLTLAACVSGDGGAAPSPAVSPTATNPGPTTGSPHPTSEATMTATQPIRITFGGALYGTVLAATLDDNAATRSLLAQLPLELTFSDYGGQELTASLPQDLDTTGLSASAPQTGDIAWYQPNRVLVLYYTSIDSWPGLYVIGHINDDVSALAGQEDLPASIARVE